MPKILRLYRNNNIKSSFEEAKASLLSLENTRADGEQIICRYLDGDGKIKAAIAIYSRGQSGSGVSVFKCSDDVASDLNKILDELDETQRGAGLNDDGTYTAPSGDDILKDAVSLFDADKKLADAIRKEVQDRIDAINALDYTDTEVDGQVVVSVSEQDGIVSNQKKKIKDIVLTDYQGKGEEGSLNISTETIGDAFGSIETYIKNLDVAPISQSGYAIVQVSEENGRISAQTGTISAETVTIKDYNGIIDAENVEDALQEMKKQIDQVGLTSNDASVTVTKPSDRTQPTDVSVNVKTGERIIRKDGGNGLYTSINIERQTSGLAANIREQYLVKDSYGVAIGDPINIYKDSSLLSVALLHSQNTYKPTYNKDTDSWTDISTPSDKNISLCFAYEDANGSVQVIAIPVGNFLVESEFKDGLTVNLNGEVMVLVDPASGRVNTKDGLVDVLTVSPNGVKVSNIQEAIDFVNENLTKAINDEIERAKDAEKVLTNSLNQEIQDRKDGDQALTVSINNEIQRAKDAEKDLTTALSNEVTRATNRENEIEKNLNNEITRAKDAEKTLTDNLETEVTRAKGREDAIEGSLNNEITRAKEAENNLDKAITAEVTRATNRENEIEGKLNNEITRATNRENDIEKNLNSEITRATDAEKTLTDNLANEVDRAKLAEEGIKDDLSEEVSRAKARENEIETALNNEIDRAKKAESDTLDAAKSYTDQEVTKEKNRADLAEKALQSEIDKETARAEKAEQGLSNDIEKEQQRAVAEEARIEGLITKEKERAEEAESDLLEKITNETTRAKEAESALTTLIEKETARAEKAESDNKTYTDSKVGDEKERAMREETRIEGLITKESERAEKAEQSITEKLEKEIERSVNKDNELENKINSLESSTNSSNQLLQTNIDAVNNRIDGLDATVSKDGEFVKEIRQVDGLISGTTAKITASVVDTAEGTTVQNELTNVKNRLTTIEANPGKSVKAGTGGVVVNESGNEYTVNIPVHNIMGSGMVITDASITGNAMTLVRGDLSIAAQDVKVNPAIIPGKDSVYSTLEEVWDQVNNGGGGSGDAVSYTAGKGLELSEENEFSVKLSSGSDNLLFLNPDGLYLGRGAVTLGPGNGIAISGLNYAVNIATEDPGNILDFYEDPGNGIRKLTTAFTVKPPLFFSDKELRLDISHNHLVTDAYGTLFITPWSANDGIQCVGDTYSIKIDKTKPENIATVGPNGLYVPSLLSSDFYKVETPLKLEQQADKIVLKLDISRTPGNALSTNADGLYCPESTGNGTSLTYTEGNGISIQGTTISIRLDDRETNLATIAEGNKLYIPSLKDTDVYTVYAPLALDTENHATLPGRMLTAIKLNISGEPGNALTKKADGLYCPASSGSGFSPIEGQGIKIEGSEINVKLSSSSDNLMKFNGQGELYVNKGEATIPPGNGITTDSNGKYIINIFDRNDQSLFFNGSSIDIVTPRPPLFVSSGSNGIPKGMMYIDFDRLVSKKAGNALYYNNEGESSDQTGLYVAPGSGDSGSTGGSQLDFTAPLTLNGGTNVSLSIVTDPEHGELLSVADGKLTARATPGPGIKFTKDTGNVCQIGIQLKQDKSNSLKVDADGLYAPTVAVDMPTEVDCGTFTI